VTLSSIGSPQATRIFYEKLFAESPELRELFGDMQSQEHKFVAMWQWVSRTLAASPESFSNKLRALGERHVKYKARLNHIRSVKRALLDMISIHVPEFLSKDQPLDDVVRAWEALLYVFVGEMGPRMLIHEDLQSFHDALSNDLAAPAGGTCLALAGAQGASLMAMAAALTRAPRAGSVERRIVDEAHSQFLKVRSALEELAGLDMAAYCRVMASVRQPRLTDSHMRTTAISEALEQAAQVPLQVAEWAVAGLKAARAFLPVAAKSGVGDAGAGAQLLAAACRTALQNISINTESMLVAKCAWRHSLNSRARALSVGLAELEADITTMVAARHTRKA